MIPYDTLVLATGACHGYFGHDDWEPFAPGLKTVEDATRLRSHIFWRSRGLSGRLNRRAAHHC